MKILFCTHDYPNYVPDLLLHGLRKLLGDSVIDYPKKQCLYDGVLGLGICPEDQLCPSWFPADEGSIDRSDLPAKIRSGVFDLIVSDLRAVPQMRRLIDGCDPPVVIIDGEDHPVRISPGNYLVCRRETDGSDHSIPLPMSLPEEILLWIAAYDDLPKKYSVGFLGSTQDGRRRQIAETIMSLYPDALLQATGVPSEETPKPAGRFGRDEYYRRLQQCRLVLSLEGAGRDTFRFWENAACNGVHLAERFPLFIPNDFTDGENILRFAGLNQLRHRIDGVLDGRVSTEDLVSEGRSHLVRHHLTTGRAKYFIDRVCFSMGPVN